MIRWRAVVAAMVVSCCAPAMSWGAPTVGSPQHSPDTLQMNTATSVTITTVITDPTYISGSANLQRINPNGTVTNLGVLRDDGTNGDATAGDRTFTLVRVFNEPQTGTVRLRVSAAFRGLLPRVFSEEVGLRVGALVPAGAGGIIPGGSGTSLTVAANSHQGQILLGSDLLQLPAITAPVGNLPLNRALSVVFDVSGKKALAVPLDVSVPAAPGTTLTEFIVADQVLLPAADGSGLKPHLLATAAAVRVGSNIVTQGAAPNPLPGIKQGGTFAIVGATGSGYVTGTVRDASNQPVSGAIVSSNTNPLVSRSNATGVYSLFVSGGPFTLTAFNPLRGTAGTAAGNIVNHNDTVNLDIALNALTLAPALPGIRNGGFERRVGGSCALTPAQLSANPNLLENWRFTGALEVVESFGPTLANPGFGGPVTILPSEGKCMAVLDTGGQAGSVASSLIQRFKVPKGASVLRWDYNYVSEEFPEFVGDIFQDPFVVRVTSINAQGGRTEVFLLQVTVDNVAGSPGFQLIGDCGFPGGDETCGMSGWRTASVNLAPFANQTVDFELLLDVTDVGDNIYDTRVFVDNIRFGTVWVDAKIVAGSAATAADVEAQVLEATEILSQAGLNVRLRPVIGAASSNGGSLLDQDLRYCKYNQYTGSGEGEFGCVAGEFLTARPACTDNRQRNGTAPGNGGTGPSQDEKDLVGQLRGSSTDVNVYWTVSSNRSGPPDNLDAYTVGPDEFCTTVDYGPVAGKTGAGVIILDSARGTTADPTPVLQILAHELGHLLIRPHWASDVLEHASGSTNFMHAPGVPVNGIMTDDQSTQIHQTINGLANPFIVD